MFEDEYDYDAYYEFINDEVIWGQDDWSWDL